VKKIGSCRSVTGGRPPARTRGSAADALLQTVELAQAAEQLGIDGAFVRVHHFERQLAVLVAVRHGGADEPDRDWHRGHRHAVRERTAG
jgi:alkanesulfonate monooxygenase SsuD/methylene tetrahydromethanopterin reductase-like flavin-dependent oxidoreductase (luciferase family)